MLSFGELRGSWGARAVVVGVLGAMLGVLTAYGQQWLPAQANSLANSTGSWALIAFLLALLGTSRPVAAVFGFLALSTLLAGYVLASSIRGYPSSFALMAFWGSAALIAGPLLGLGAHWLKTGRGYLAALGAGGLSGVLIGEGVYGLAFIADTTYPPYWWASIAAGVAFLTWASARRLGRPRPVAVAVAVSLVTAAAFVVLYSQDLLALFAQAWVPSIA